MISADHTLDTLGLLCPLPVLKARKTLKSMQQGQVLAVLADDPAAIIDVPHFCHESGHELIGQQDATSDSAQGPQTHQVYLIRKSG